RFAAPLDPPAVLGERARRRAEAETLTHLGLIARGHSRPAAFGWLGRALRTVPWHGPAWHALAATAVPDVVRRLVRAVRGTSGEWERRNRTPFNRPEPILSVVFLLL